MSQKARHYATCQKFWKKCETKLKKSSVWGGKAIAKALGLLIQEIAKDPRQTTKQLQASLASV